MGVIRKTKSVKEVLTIFDQQSNSISAVNLVERLKTSMNKTTVYRILDRLEDEGTIHSFTHNNGQKWYAKCQGCSSSAHHDTHPHFQCKVCGKTECLDITISIPEIPNKRVESAEMLLVGQCDECVA
jgi:Fur family ferric uptake transcriptional regulator